MDNQNHKIPSRRIKISLEDKINILNRLKNGEKSSSVARTLNLNSSTIRTIKHNESKIRKAMEEARLNGRYMVNVAKVANQDNEEQLKRRVRIPLKDKIDILNRIKNGEKSSSVAMSLNISASTIRTIKHNERQIRKCVEKARLNDRYIANQNNQNQSKRSVISLHDKVDILNLLKNGEKSAAVAKSLNMNVNTIRRIKRNESMIRKSVAEAHVNNRNASYIKNSDLIKMDGILIIWVERCLKKKIPLNGNMIKQKALKIYNQLKRTTDQSNKSFVASDGWLDKFKKRHNLYKKKLQGEQASANTYRSC